MEPPPPKKNSIPYAWGVLVALALVARLAALGQRAVSHDESLHTHFSWLFQHTGHYAHDPMTHGPLLFHINAALYALFGTSDFVSRLAPAFAGTACVAMLHPFRRWLGERGAFLSAILVAVHPALLAYSRYIRNDIYICLFTLIIVHGLLRYRETRQPKYLLTLTLGLALGFAAKEVTFIHGFVLGLICIGFCMAVLVQHCGRPTRATLPALLRNPWCQVAVLILTLALPFATGLAHHFFPWDPRQDVNIPDIQRQIHLIGLLLTFLATLLAALVFLPARKFHIWAACFLLFWGLQALLHTTLFTDTARGMASALYGALAYWLQQHGVKRGAEDPFFYLTLHLLYDPLLLLTLPLGLRRIRNPARTVFLCWFLGNLIIYSWAGEKMPWLMLHTALPLCLIAGPALADLLQPIPRPLRNHKIRLTLQTFCALLSLQLLINSVRLNGPNAASPAEPLYYAHGGEHLKTALHLIETHQQQYPQGNIHLHKPYTWPMVWYFRETPYQIGTHLDLIPESATIAIVPLYARPAFAETEWTARGTYDMIHWPRQRWHALTSENLRNLLRNPAVRRKFLRFYLFRDVPPPGPGDFPAPTAFLLLTREPQP